ncbi:transposable element Tcb1 transposase [Trichonephila clavipes]|nr:transposable element Tcb1 transposase [Trichonephila clavipes]
METIPNHTDSCPKARRRSLKGYNPRGRSIYCYSSLAESQSDLHTCDIYGYGVRWIPHRPDRTDLYIFKRGSVTAFRYQDEVLEPIVRLYAAAVDPTFVLMDDNARPHRADIVDDYLENKGIARMAWPAYSSDLTLIENLSDALGRAVSSRFPPPATLIELETALQEEW